MLRSEKALLVICKDTISCNINQQYERNFNLKLTKVGLLSNE